MVNVEQYCCCLVSAPRAYHEVPKHEGPKTQRLFQYLDMGLCL